MSDSKTGNGEYSDVQRAIVADLLGHGIDSSSNIVSGVLRLIGNGVQAMGVAAAAVDPLQFAFVVGMTLFALNYLDQTEPYATIIRTLKLHDLIKGLHVPGEGQKDLSNIKNAADCCITGYMKAGIPVPPAYYQLRDVADTEYQILKTVDQIIPGAGALENYITGLFNGFGAKTPLQMLSDAADQIRAQCRKNTGYDCNGASVGPHPVPGSGPTTFNYGYIGADGKQTIVALPAVITGKDVFGAFLIGLPNSTIQNQAAVDALYDGPISTPLGQQWVLVPSRFGK